MFSDSEKRFTLKAAKEKGVRALYEGYCDVKEKSGMIVNEESVEYLKLFVQHDYKKCIRIIREKHNKHLTLTSYEGDYLHCTALIAAYYADNGEPIKGLLWAMKSIEFCNRLYGTMDVCKKHEVLNNTTSADIYHELYHKYPVQDLYDQFYLDWEIKEGLHLDYSLRINDNNPN